MKTFECVLAGYNGATDAGDNLIKWINATELAQVTEFAARQSWPLMEPPRVIANPAYDKADGVDFELTPDLTTEEQLVRRVAELRTKARALNPLRAEAEQVRDAAEVAYRAIETEHGNAWTAACDAEDELNEFRDALTRGEAGKPIIAAISAKCDEGAKCEATTSAKPDTRTPAEQARAIFDVLNEAERRQLRAGHALTWVHCPLVTVHLFNLAN